MNSSDHCSESLQLGCACLQSPGAFNSRQGEESSPSSFLCTCLGLTYKQDALPFTTSSFVVALRWFPLKTSMLGGVLVEEIKPDISALSHLPSHTPPYYFTTYSFVFLTHEPIQRESHLRLFSHGEDAISLHRTEITPRESFLFPELRAPPLLCKTIARGGKRLETITETLRICCTKNPMETKATATYPLSVFCVNKYIYKYIQAKTHYFFQGKITRQCMSEQPGH